MKILIFGRGVIATQYAWALEKVGHTVEFYVRPGLTIQYGSKINLIKNGLKKSWISLRSLIYGNYEPYMNECKK